MHTPERQDAVQAARAKGARHANKIRALQAKRSKLSTASELVTFTARTIHDTLDGHLLPDVARVVLYGISIQRQLVEASDMEDRIAALERAQPQTVRTFGRGNTWTA